MKKKNSAGKYLFILLSIALLIWVVFEYLDYTRFDAPVDYNYNVNEEIDYNYHDQSVVKEYLKNVYEIGLFANEQWYNFEIDVRFVDHENLQSKLASEIYRQMMTQTKYMEEKLLQSKQWKEQGLDNEAIKYLEESGTSVEIYRFRQQFKRATIALNDSGQEVKHLQNLLYLNGYEIARDGLFKEETKKAIVDYQLKNNLIPTGVANQETLYKLYQQEKKK